LVYQWLSFGEGQGEVEEDRREEHQAYSIHPVERRVPDIQFPGERDAIGKKPKHAQEVEVGGARDAAPTRVNDGAHDE
jgi:hypothetical protein